LRCFRANSGAYLPRATFDVFLSFRNLIGLATLYLKDKTYAQMAQRFKPLVPTAMSEVGVTSAYQRLTTVSSALEMGESLDLDQYVTGKALDGLFFMLAQEETKIRSDPAARVTDLLRKVFSAPK
jgi:hypothetical protein